jgi:hypothetical protein
MIVTVWVIATGVPRHVRRNGHDPAGGTAWLVIATGVPRYLRHIGHDHDRARRSPPGTAPDSERIEQSERNWRMGGDGDQPFMERIHGTRYYG